MRQIVLDTETTGLSAETGDRIIEIGCVELVARKLTGNNRHFYLNPERDSVVQAALPSTPLSGSIGAPAFPPRPGTRQAAARSAGDGKRGATRSHTQRSEHGEDGEHCTFAAASTVASSIQVEAATSTMLTTEAPSRTP